MKIPEVKSVIRECDGAMAPELSLVSMPGPVTGIMKDFAKTNLLMRTIVGRWILGREQSILKRLEGLPCVPRLLARPTPNSAVYEYFESKTLKKYRKGELPYDIFLRLEEAVEMLHSRGVVHFDLRQKKNILISPEGEVYLVDYATSFFFRLEYALQRRLFELVKNVDRSALLKIKRRYFPDRLTEDEKEFLRKFIFLRYMWFVRPKRPRASDKVPA